MTAATRSATSTNQRTPAASRTLPSEANRVVGANRYLKRVRYGNDTPYLPGHRGPDALPTSGALSWCSTTASTTSSTPTPDEVTTWSCRPDPFSSYRSGFEIRTYRTCRRLLMFHAFRPSSASDPVLVRSTDLTYETSDAPGDPTRPVPEHARLGHADGLGRAGRGTATRPKQLPALDARLQPPGDRRTQQTADPESLENFAGPFDGTAERWVDLDGEGLQGILTEDEGAWYYKHNVSTWNPDGGPASARFEPLDAARRRSPRGAVR